jgi:EAL domain-containing protein (putative c-di-GMP-specific phosphodiesterase class I)
VRLASEEVSTSTGRALRSRGQALTGRERGRRVEEQLARRTHVEQGLRRALEEDELELVYQPVVDVRTGAIVEGEALLRWHPPEWGLMAPTEFIPVAEESGVILPLGRWVLRRGCAAAARWGAERGGGAVRVAINVSGRQVVSGELVQDVRDALAATGLSPHLLRLEITESVLIDDPVIAAEAIEDLRHLGVALSIDDFGTGYSSLLYLRDYPVDTVKVDRLFVAGLGPSRADTAIVQAVVRLAHALSLLVTAEGVETEDQLRLLGELGCDAAQGFLWSPGVPADQFHRLLAQRSSIATVPRRVAAGHGQAAADGWPTAPREAVPSPLPGRAAMGRLA